MKSTNGKRKIQASILEFATAKPLVSTDQTDNNTIDLTIENELAQLLDTIILCPVCNVDITCNLPDDRNRHVEMCLVRDESSQKSVKKPKLLSPLEKTRLSYVNKSSRVAGIVEVKQEIKIELESSLIQVKSQLENTLDAPIVDLDCESLTQGESIAMEVVETASKSTIKPPTSIVRSKGRKEIPRLKILSFPVDSNASYEIAVDAFNYAPHATISQYILTHFHGDHYGGISKKWSYERVFEDDDYGNDDKYKKIIYCTKITGSLLTLRFKIDERFIKKLDVDKRYLIKSFVENELPDGGYISSAQDPGVYVTPITANHCPGAAIFLFESISLAGYTYYSLHCGDFRVNRDILMHPELQKFSINGGDTVLNKVYLDTTYMAPQYNFPKQELVCETVAQMFHDLVRDESTLDQSLVSKWFGIMKQRRITDFMNRSTTKKRKFLILVGTYLIGKEKLAISVLKRLQCPIYILNIKSRDDKAEIIRIYEDEYLDKVISTNDVGDDMCDCVIHLVPMNIVGTTKELSNYFNHNKYYEHFERCVGLRPTGWSFVSRWAKFEPDFTNDEAMLVQLIDTMKTCQTYTYTENILPQSPMLKSLPKTKGRPEQSLYRIYSVPYSEHSSYRELSYFCIFLNIDEIVPTVNMENEQSRKDMASIIRLWEMVRKIKLDKSAQHLHKSLCDCILGITLEDF